MSLRLPRFGPKTKVLFGLLVAIAVVVAVFDWNWFRGAAERYYTERSGRTVRIGDLHVGLDLALAPTIRLRGLYVENSAWADNRPFIAASEVRFTFSLKSLWQRRPVISKLVLIDADVDLERQADGLRNWRLRNPDDRGPGKVRVLRLEAQHSRLRLVRRDIDLELVAAAGPAEPGGENPRGFSTRIGFKGAFKGAAFSGEALTNELLTLMETRESFPLQGHVQTGDTRLEVDGTLADLIRPSVMDADIRLVGPSLSQLRPFVKAKLPASRPYEIEGNLLHAGGDYTVQDLRARVGATRLSGDIRFNRAAKRPLLEAALRSDSADYADLASLAGIRESPKPDPGGDGKIRAAQTEVKADPSGRLFPVKPMPFPRLQSLDAKLDLVLKKFKVAAWPALESLKLEAGLEDGVLAVTVLDVGLAEGSIKGSLSVDGRRQPARLAAKLRAGDVRLEQLLNGTRLAKMAAGPLSGRLELKGQGASVADILGTASGTVAIGLDHGVMSGITEGLLELDLGDILRALISGNKAIALNKADIEFDFDGGVGTSRNIFIDTEQTRVLGTGRVDLRDESLDLVLTPQPKKPGLFALDSAIRIKGSIRKPRFSVVPTGKRQGP